MKKIFNDTIYFCHLMLEEGIIIVKVHYRLFLTWCIALSLNFYGMEIADKDMLSVLVGEDTVFLPKRLCAMTTLQDEPLFGLHHETDLVTSFSVIKKLYQSYCCKELYQAEFFNAIYVNFLQSSKILDNVLQHSFDSSCVLNSVVKKEFGVSAELTVDSLCKKILQGPLSEQNFQDSWEYFLCIKKELLMSAVNRVSIKTEIDQSSARFIQAKKIIAVYFKNFFRKTIDQMMVKAIFPKDMRLEDFSILALSFKKLKVDHTIMQLFIDCAYDHGMLGNIQAANYLLSVVSKGFMKKECKHSWSLIQKKDLIISAAVFLKKYKPFNIESLYNYNRGVFSRLGQSKKRAYAYSDTLDLTACNLRSLDFLGDVVIKSFKKRLISCYPSFRIIPVEKTFTSDDDVSIESIRCDNNSIEIIDLHSLKDISVFKTISFFNNPLKTINIDSVGDVKVKVSKKQQEDNFLLASQIITLKTRENAVREKAKKTQALFAHTIITKHQKKLEEARQKADNFFIANQIIVSKKDENALPEYVKKPQALFGDTVIKKRQKELEKVNQRDIQEGLLVEKTEKQCQEDVSHQ